MVELLFGTLPRLGSPSVPVCIPKLGLSSANCFDMLLPNKWVCCVGMLRTDGAGAIKRDGATTDMRA